MTPDEIEELKFLRYFYEAAGEVFGPANNDIYADISEEYTEETGNKVPEDYQ